jgi:glycosyltransferase involved in cell wall biosynthesis
MAAGVPVVSVVRPDNFPGLELRSGEDVVIVPPDDPRHLAEALARLLSDRDYAQRIGAGQQAFVKKYLSIDAVTDRHADLYKSLTVRRLNGTKSQQRLDGK